MTEQEGREILDELVESKFPSTDKDALIRALVGIIQGIRSVSTDGKSFALYAATVRDGCKKALTLARTTCPEAFESNLS